LVGPSVYGLAVAFSFLAPVVSLGLYVTVTVFYILFGGKYFH
jgi:hypothetical protein